MTTLVRYHDVTTSSNDERDYRALYTCNKMKVMLVSDPTTDKSAASLDVNIGYFKDPAEVPGLAHFCEHMLFLGTTKYPEVNDYNQYLKQHGGFCNAFTNRDHTNYYFDVDPTKLEGALDRFSQFFKCPLFTESSVEKELNAVHLEYMNNLSNDDRRLNQFDKSSADPNHVYSKFGSGNKETLETIPKQRNVDVRQQLLKFYNTWYSANVMSLCVLGKESCDELEELVLEKFSGIENKNVKLNWMEHPFNDTHFRTKWYIVPVKDIRKLVLKFPIPDLRENFGAAPEYYWEHLLERRGKGSLYLSLKTIGWCNSLMARSKFPTTGFGFFSIRVELTEEGLSRIDDIITMVFQYMNMLKKEGPVKWIFEEYRDIASLNFRFHEKVSPSRYVQEIVHSLQEVPDIHEVLSAPKLFTKWKPNLINEVMRHLIPEKIRVHIVSKTFEADADMVEKWYGTKYKKEKIPDELIQKWKNSGEGGVFHLPEKNEFIPTNFDIKASKNADEFPSIIADTPIIRAWFKQDDKFLVPKATMKFIFASPLVNMDPSSENMSCMFVYLLRDALNERTCNAALAGLKWELSQTLNGISLTVAGYHDKVDILLKTILDYMMDLHIDEKRFEILKEHYIRRLKNFEAERPLQHAIHYLRVLLSERYWTTNQLLNTSSMITLERVKQFIAMFLSKMYIECLMYGNITRFEASQTIQAVESKLSTTIKHFTPTIPRQLMKSRGLALPDACHYLYEAKNKHHKSSCAQVYYQVGLQSTENNMLLELLQQIISEPCFTTLRTKEQLGYSVHRSVFRNNDIQGLRILVQSDKHPEFVQQRIDAFVESMETYLTNMSEEVFEEHKESLATKRLEKPKRLSSQADIYWREIVSQHYNFDRANLEVAYLRTITRDQMIAFYKKFIHSQSASRRKLCVHVLSTAEGGAGSLASKEAATTVDESEAKNQPDEEQQQEFTRIVDLLQFQISHPLYLSIRPFTDLPIIIS